MAQIPKVVDQCARRLERMAADRAPFENDWMDIRDLVRPISVGYSKITNNYVSLRTQFMYDGTAPDALEELAAALHSYTMNPAERWFELQIEDYDSAQDPMALAWLEISSDIIYSYYQRESACLNQAAHECFLDIGSFGSSCMYQEWSYKLRGLLFSSKPVSDCYFMENSENIVDTMFRRIAWTIRQVEQEFGQLPPELAKQKNQDMVVECIHAVFPRTDRSTQDLVTGNKAWASVWYCNMTKELLEPPGGYDSFPYLTPRWTKLSGEMYGRGPAKKCLPDIKMLNAMEKTLLKAGQKAVDPPLVVTDEGFLLPLRTSPGALIFKEQGAENPEPLKFEGNLPWGLEQANGKREFVRQCFYNDWTKLGKDNVEMTAWEAQDRREEKLRKMSPMLGRLYSEFHSPMVGRSYFLLNERGMIPPAPQSVHGMRLRVSYSSPASRAQIGIKGFAMARYIQELIPLAQANPDILDAIDWDKYAQELAKWRGVPRTVLHTIQDIQAIRQKRQQQQVMSQAAQIAEPASKAIKNLADAGSKGGAMPQLQELMG